MFTLRLRPFVLKLLREFLDIEKIRCVDMLDRFRQADKHGRLFLFRDSHWNLAGSRLAADILQERLTSR